jgi:hypothetical protein
MYLGLLQLCYCEKKCNTAQKMARYTCWIMQASGMKRRKISDKCMYRSRVNYVEWDTLKTLFN